METSIRPEFTAADWTGDSPGQTTGNNVAVETDNSNVSGPAWVTNSPIPVTNGLSQTTRVSDGVFVYSIGGGLGAGPDSAIDKLTGVLFTAADAEIAEIGYLISAISASAAVNFGPCWCPPSPQRH